MIKGQEHRDKNRKRKTKREREGGGIPPDQL